MKSVTRKDVEAWTRSYQASKEAQLATLAFSKTDINDVVYSIKDAFAMAPKFSIDIPTLPVTSQEMTGRCWLFSATNVLREKIAKDLNLENFELSQSYLAFWDKFERCNYLLENVLATADLPTDDRTVQFLLTTGVHDGGQWEMFANIVRKYGLVPKDVYNETYQSSHSRTMNYLLNKNMKANAVKLRKMKADGCDEKKLQAEKKKMLEKAYHFLCTCYTAPPVKFDFEYVDKKRKYHVDKGLTPLSFTEKYIGNYLDNVVSIINAPTKDKPYHQTYTIECLGNVAGGNDVVHLNLPMNEFKKAVIAQLKAGKVVWFGSDVGHDGERKKGVWDDNSYKASFVTGLDLDLTKEDALDYWFAAMNHAMVITGVHLEKGKPVRWKIENSWGDQNGVKGYYTCSDTWFDQYVFQAAVEKEYLGDLAKDAEKKPVVLKPWDPMGTLAD